MSTCGWHKLQAKSLRFIGASRVVIQNFYPIVVDSESGQNLPDLLHILFNLTHLNKQPFEGIFHIQWSVCLNYPRLKLQYMTTTSRFLKYSCNMKIIFFTWQLMSRSIYQNTVQLLMTFRWLSWSSLLAKLTDHTKDIQGSKPTYAIPLNPTRWETRCKHFLKELWC